MLELVVSTNSLCYDQIIIKSSSFRADWHSHKNVALRGNNEIQARLEVPLSKWLYVIIVS